MSYAARYGRRFIPISEPRRNVPCRDGKLAVGEDAGGKPEASGESRSAASHAAEGISIFAKVSTRRPREILAGTLAENYNS